MKTHLKNARTYSMVVLLAALFCTKVSSQVSYWIPITLTNGTNSTVLRLGVNPGNSIGVDTNSALGAFREVPAPPAPPAPFPWDSRIVTIPGRVSTFPIGLSGGVLNDYRGYVSPSQVDSFKIIIQGDETDNAATTISWPSNLADFGNSWTIKPQTGSAWPTTNMLTSSSVQIDAGATKNIIIIKAGAINLPVQLASFIGIRSSNNTVQLDWTTISEVNNFGFYAERKTSSDSEFVELANSFLPGHGTTNVPQHYQFIDADAPSSSLHYRLKQVDLDGSEHRSEPIQVNVTTVVRENSPASFGLRQNFPNPFNPTTEIRFSVAEKSDVSLKIFNMLGQEVATLVNETKSAGKHSVTFDASGVSSGVYFYRLQSAGRSALKMMTLLK